MADETGKETPAPAIRSADDLAALLPDFPREAVDEALEKLVAAGVLAPETDENGERVYRYTNPEKYKMINVPVVKVPGPEFGKR